MITEEYLRRSHLFRRLKNERHGAARLVKDELAGTSTWRRLKLVADLFSWIKGCGLKLTDLSEHMTDRYLKYRAGKRSIQSSDKMSDPGWKQDDDRSTSGKSAATAACVIGNGAHASITSGG
jgi:hypothetical protein